MSSAFASLNQTPGPGAYQPEKYNKTAKIAYSIASKYDEKAWNKVPGPGSYKEPSFLDNKKPMSFPR